MSEVIINKVEQAEQRRLEELLAMVFMGLLSNPDDERLKQLFAKQVPGAELGDNIWMALHYQAPAIGAPQRDYETTYPGYQRVSVPRQVNEFQVQSTRYGMDLQIRRPIEFPVCTARKGGYSVSWLSVGTSDGPESLVVLLVQIRPTVCVDEGISVIVKMDCSPHPQHLFDDLTVPLPKFADEQPIDLPGPEWFIYPESFYRKGVQLGTNCTFARDAAEAASVMGLGCDDLRVATTEAKEQIVEAAHRWFR